MTLPVWVSKFIVDFVETGIAAVLAVTFVIPTNLDQAKQVAVIIGAALAGALVAAARRAAPDFIVWFKGKLGQ